jgi:hypothetical protein
MMQRKGFLTVLAAFCLLLSTMASAADTQQQVSAQDVFRTFQGVMKGLVTGDANAVLDGCTKRYWQDIVSANRTSLMEYKDNTAVREKFERITGRPYAELLAMSDRELAAVVINRMIPRTRTEEEKRQTVSLIDRATMSDHRLQDGRLLLKVAYPEGPPETVTFIKEDGAWRLDDVR